MLLENTCYSVISYPWWFGSLMTLALTKNVWKQNPTLKKSGALGQVILSSLIGTNDNLSIFRQEHDSNPYGQVIISYILIIFLLKNKK